MHGFPAWKLVADLFCVCVSFSFWMMQCCFIKSQTHIYHRIIFISFLLQRKENSSMGLLWGVLSGLCLWIQPFMWPKVPPSTEKGKSLHTSSLIVRGESILWAMYFAHPNPCYRIWQALITACTSALWEEMGCMGMRKPTPAISHLYGWCFLHRGQQPEHHHTQIFPGKKSDFHRTSPQPSRYF